MSNPLDEVLPPDENKPNAEITELTEDQKKKVIECWNSRPNNPPSLKELAELCFGAGIDGRDKRSKLLKAFLGSRKLKAPVSYQYQKKGDLELTEEQKEFVANNINSMTCLEIAEILYNRKLTNLSQETRAVINYSRTLNSTVKYSDPRDIATDKYKAPKIDSSMIDRVNKYIDEPIDKVQYDKNDKQKKYIKALIGYINSYRFIQQINTYEMVDDRDLFESSFINYCYGKDDLTAEERDQYILLCTDVVAGKHILRRIEAFQKMADEYTQGDENKKSMSMTIVEMISSLRKEYNDCVKRQTSLIDDLKGKRSARLKDRVKENESLVSLVEYWKNEETRKRLIEANMVRREKTKNEVKRLEDMDAIKFEIFGVDPLEIINS